MLTPNDLRVATVPNAITLVRLLMIPVILYLLMEGDIVEGLALTGLALFTDYLDGNIARRTNSKTFLGAILDPVADKLITLACLGFFTYAQLLPKGYFLLSSVRDISQLMAIPILIGYKKILFQVQPNIIAKTATATKFAIIALMFTWLVFPFQNKQILLPLIIFSTMLELYVFITYILRFKLIYRGKHDTFE